MHAFKFLFNKGKGPEQKCYSTRYYGVLQYSVLVSHSREWCYLCYYTHLVPILGIMYSYWLTSVKAVAGNLDPLVSGLMWYIDTLCIASSWPSKDDVSMMNSFVCNILFSLLLSRSGCAFQQDSLFVHQSSFATASKIIHNNNALFLICSLGWWWIYAWATKPRLARLLIRRWSSDAINAILQDKSKAWQPYFQRPSRAINSASRRSFRRR